MRRGFHEDLFLVAVSALLAAACSSEVQGNSGDDSSPSSEHHLVMLGESNAHPTSCLNCTMVFPEQVGEALSDALGSAVKVVNLAWDLRNPEPVEMADLLEYVRTDELAREELAEADAVLIHAAQNDLA